jgi:DNA polymerase I-like protein with 3'-5' exonuclease and polymerase domains
VQEDVVRAAQIIRTGMESAVALKVPTPVRLKIGTSWGDIQDMKDVNLHD